MDIKDFHRDDILRALGLQTRNDPADQVLAALGLFGAGLVVGAGLGLLFAPSSGRELRGDIGSGVSRAVDKAKDKIPGNGEEPEE